MAKTHSVHGGVVAERPQYYAIEVRGSPGQLYYIAWYMVSMAEQVNVEHDPKAKKFHVNFEEGEGMFSSPEYLVVCMYNNRYSCLPVQVRL